MTTAARLEGDVRVTGDLQVDGSMPTIQRSGLQQESAAVYAVPVTRFRVHDSIDDPLPAAGASDDLGCYGGTYGTDAPKLSTGDLKAAGATTRYGRDILVLPPEYVAGQTVTLRLSAGMETTIADTTATVEVECYKSDREGAADGSDICATAAQSINSLTFADKDFTITPTGLTAGDQLDVRLALAVNDGATGTAVIATIGAVELLLDIKG